MSLGVSAASPSSAMRRRHRLACLRGLIAEIGQRRYGLRGRVVAGGARRPWPCRGRHVQAGDRQGRRLVLEFRDDALRQLLADARRLLHRRPVLQGDGVGEVLRSQRAQHGQRHLGADALDGLQRAEPGALHLAGEPVKADGVLAHVRLDGEADLLARPCSVAQRARRRLHLVAHAVDVDDGVRSRRPRRR